MNEKLTGILLEIAEQLGEIAEALNKGNATAGDIAKTLRQIHEIWENDASDSEADDLLAALEEEIRFDGRGRTTRPAPSLHLVAPGDDDRSE